MENLKLTVLLLCFVINATIVFGEDLALPNPTGQYAIGTKAIELKDETRSMFRDANTRRWMVQAWYPSLDHNGLYSYMPDTLENSIVTGVQVRAHAKPEAKKDASRQFPLIIFVPGLGGERQRYTILCEELASHGFIVLALDCPYVSNFVKFFDGTKIVLTLKDVWNVPRDREYRYKYYDDAMDGAIKDIGFMLDNLHIINNDYFSNIINEKCIVLMGHSFGGNVAHTLGFTDDRVKAVVDIDSKITERKVYGRIGIAPNESGKPVLFIRGMLQYQEAVGDQLTEITNATVWSPEVEHSAFSDNGYFAAKINGFGKQGFFSKLFNWFFKRGPYWDDVDTNLGQKDVKGWFDEYRGHVIKWLEKNVSCFY